MERRVLLAISLSFLVLFGYQRLFVPPAPLEGPSATTPGNTSALGSAPQAQIATSAPGNLTPAAPVVAVPESTLVVGESAERQIIVDTQKVRAVFSNRGATLLHWILKEYKNDQGGALDLVPEAIPAPLPQPFALRTDDAVQTTRLNTVLYRVSGVAGDTMDATAQPATLTFEVETAEGLRARKVYAFEPASFIVSFTANVQQGTQPVNPSIEWGPGLNDDIARTSAGSFLSPAYLYKAQAIYHRDGDVEREAASAIGTGVARDGTFRWAGIDDHYFISAVLQPPSPLHVEYRPIVIPAMNAAPLTGDYMSFAVRFPSPPEGVKFYVGPKQLDLMRSIDPEFTRAIYFGMFAWLAAPLLDGLTWVHRYIGNWGWSIIALTILINLAMFPLRHKSVVAMRRMQDIQPQLKAIQERYANLKITDPARQKMNTEVMDLYRSKGVNPAAGCVPTLLTMPFLFAFYAMLGQAIEIRGQDFLGWIPDLSRADPFYVTPLLMGLTMFWQMRLQPATADPTQQKVMMFMPVMITVTMLFAPAGLVIYWLVSNLWGIGQQYFTNWLIGPAKTPALAGSKAGRVAKGAGRASDPPKDIVVPPSGGKK
jgi:YidC/Oxa1 family membrane protein insertase